MLPSGIAVSANGCFICDTVPLIPFLWCHREPLDSSPSVVGLFPLSSTLPPQSCWSWPFGCHSGFRCPSLSLHPLCSHQWICSGQGKPGLSNQLYLPFLTINLNHLEFSFIGVRDFVLTAAPFSLLLPLRWLFTPPEPAQCSLAGNQSWRIDVFINTCLALSRWAFPYAVFQKYSVHIAVVVCVNPVAPLHVQLSQEWVLCEPRCAPRPPCPLSLEAILPSPVSHLHSPQHGTNLGGQFEQRHSHKISHPWNGPWAFHWLAQLAGPKITTQRLNK